MVPAEAAPFGRFARRELAAGAVFALALAGEILLFGLHLTPERFLLVPLAAALVLRRTRAYVRDFLPFLLVVLLYEELRGLAHILNPHPYYRPQIRMEEWLFGGHLPTVELQHLLWTGRLHVYDQVIVAFGWVHFFVPLALAFFFWLKDRRLFQRFTRTYLALSFAGAVTFLLYPSAPPWAAARAGIIAPVAALGSSGAHPGRGLILPNPYASIPSLHAGYALLVFLFIATYIRTWRWRWPLTFVAALYPLSMGFARVYTGDHYVVDLLVGFLFALAAFVGVPALAGHRALPSISPRFAAGLATTVAALTLLTAFAAAATGGLLRVSASQDLNRVLGSARTGRVVHLSSVLPFAWSRVYVFPGDTQPQEINRALGFAWPEASTGATPVPSPASRSNALLVFVRSGSTHRQVVREVRYDGADVRLDCLLGHSFTRADAQFRVASRLVEPFLAYRRALVPVSEAVLSPGCLVTRSHALP